IAQALWLLLAAIGLALSVSYAGMPVLGQGAFIAIGGFATALLGPSGQGWPMLIDAAATIGIAVGAGYPIAIGASRLEGGNLAPRCRPRRDRCPWRARRAGYADPAVALLPLRPERTGVASAGRRGPGRRHSPLVGTGRRPGLPAGPAGGTRGPADRRTPAGGP